MIPVGYMAKRVYKKAEQLKVRAITASFEKMPQVVDVYSVSNCLSKDFADYIRYWKHNGYWLFDSPEIIKNLAKENSIRLEETSLFYYETHEMEFDGERWVPWSSDPSFPTNIVLPVGKEFQGFDVVCFSLKTSPECSPLSCNGIAEEVQTNSHCLLDTFAEAETSLNDGKFENAEPGPYRIFAVYSVDWS
ncbi:MAG TPA: hypothetical protein VE377_09800 [Candidatus Dormibacteraeota bacterium]|nr:hypothetical protein [Candidatus Dormibacteraeota bacterium]